MYFPTLDLRELGVGQMGITSPVHGEIEINLPLLQCDNLYGTASHEFNMVLTSLWTGFDVAETQLLQGMPTLTLLEALTQDFQGEADANGWTDPETIAITFNPITQRVTFAYPAGLSAITFPNTASRRLFGFVGSFAGSASSVTGTELPSYIVESTIDGASMASVIYEDEASMVAAFSATGRSYALARTTAPMRRSWVQQYEPLAKTYRRHSTGAYTFEQLFEQCRASRPFAVYGGFVHSDYTAYYFDEEGASFHPMPATPGNADQFHIPFTTIAVGKHA